MYDLKLFSIYTLCFQEKNVFLMWDLKSFRIYTLYSQDKKFKFFQYGIKNVFV
jgi:hypothetical protein